MRLYGSSRQDAGRCRYGCCGGKCVPKYSNEAIKYVKALRKKARRYSKHLINKLLNEIE